MRIVSLVESYKERSSAFPTFLYSTLNPPLGRRRFPSVQVHFEAAVTALSQDDQRVTTSLQAASGAYQVTARYVLACDGARSFVRAALGIPFPGSRIDEPHLVVDLADFPDRSNHSRFFCNPTRPVNSIPAPYGGRRMEFMLSSSDDHDHIVTDQGVRELVQPSWSDRR